MRQRTQGYSWEVRLGEKAGETWTRFWYARSASLLHEAIRDNCVDGIIFALVVPLECGIIWSGDRCEQYSGVAVELR